jgi:hypothetical protein
VRGGRLFLSVANGTSQRNGKVSRVVFNIFNTTAQIYINLLENTKMFNLTEETEPS